MSDSRRKSRVIVTINREIMNIQDKNSTFLVNFVLNEKSRENIKEILEISSLKNCLFKTNCTVAKTNEAWKDALVQYPLKGISFAMISVRKVMRIWYFWWSTSFLYGKFWFWDHLKGLPSCIVGKFVNIMAYSLFQMTGGGENLGTFGVSIS